MNRAPAANLHNAGANQSDASFGFTAAIAEALLQSHASEISLLPALPSQWTDGSVTGLRTRGDSTVNIHWKDEKLESADISNPKGGEFKIRNGAKTGVVTIKPGKTIHLNADLVMTD